MASDRTLETLLRLRSNVICPLVEKYLGTAEATPPKSFLTPLQNTQPSTILLKRTPNP